MPPQAGWKPSDSPQRAACRPRGCLDPWCLVQTPRWIWQPADPSHTLSGKTPPASSCREEAEAGRLEAEPCIILPGTLRRLSDCRGGGVNGGGGVERHFSLMAREVCRFSGICGACGPCRVQMDQQTRGGLTGSHGGAQLRERRENSCVLLAHDSIR